MNHTLFVNIDDLLAPGTLSELESRSVNYVRCLPFNMEDSKSGSRFFRVATNDGTSPGTSSSASR